MGFFDLFKSESSIENVCISRSIPKLKEWKIDTLFITTSRRCDCCEKYNRKIYSLYGKSRIYPPAPNFIKNNNSCPQCGVYIGASIFIEGISEKINIDIIASPSETDSEDCLNINNVLINMYALYCKYPYDKISAIKKIRQLTGCSLTQGKSYVDEYYKTIQR